MLFKEYGISVLIESFALDNERIAALQEIKAELRRLWLCRHK